MDGVVPKPDTVPPSTVSTVTSDYYSDSAREEIAQDHIPMVQPATPSQETPVVPTSNTERTSTAHFKDGQEVMSISIMAILWMCHFSLCP